MRLVMSALTLMLLVVCPLVPAADAQTSRDARVLVTVVDQTGGIVTGATVTLAGLETPTQAQAAPTATTGENGIATFERVVLGRYSVRAEFPGFDAGLVREVRIRTGDNKQSSSCRWASSNRR